MTCYGDIGGYTNFTRPKLQIEKETEKKAKARKDEMLDRKSYEKIGKEIKNKQNNLKSVLTDSPEAKKALSDLSKLGSDVANSGSVQSGNLQPVIDKSSIFTKKDK